MARPAPRTLIVDRIHALTPNLTRVVLGGEALHDFPAGYESGYVKLVLEEDEGTAMRSFTVRSFEPAARELVLDMVSHGDAGPAARWIRQVSLGDRVTVSGPGACKMVNTDADWFLLAGDMSALPAILCNLETLPLDAAGDIVLEVISEHDILPLEVPQGMNLHWVVNPDPASPNTVLEDTVMALPWRDGRVSVWVAGEFSASRTLRQYFRHQKQVDRDAMYVSCYWKIGDTDEGMKAAKRADPEPW